MFFRRRSEADILRQARVDQLLVRADNLLRVLEDIVMRNAISPQSNRSPLGDIVSSAVDGLVSAGARRTEVPNGHLEDAPPTTTNL